MVSDFLKTIKALLYERIASPLKMGSFILSWCLWNFRFFIVILSSLPVDEKFDYVDQVIFPDVSSVFLRGMLYPLVTTAFFIYLYPFPARKVYEYWRMRQKELKEVKQRIDDEVPLTREEASSLRSEMYRIEREYQENLAKRDAEIDRLKSMTALVKSTFSENSNTEDYVENKQSIFLIKLKELKNYTKEVTYVFGLFKDVTALSENQIINSMMTKLQKSRVETEFVLGELASKELLRRDRTPIGSYEYTLTHEGRRIALLLGTESASS